MDGFRGGECLVLVFWLLVIGATGCANFDLTAGPSCWRFPWDEKPDVVPGITSPTERIEILQKMREKAAWAKPAEQQRISAELAESIRVEADPLIRAEIVRALAEYPTQAATSVLQAALKDSDTEVRVAACEALAKQGGTEATTVLGEALSGDVDLDVRLAAARALGQTNDERALAALGVALEDQNPAMQHRAVASLRKLTGENFGNDVNRWREYVNSDRSKPAKPVSIAERFRRMF